MLKEMQCCKQYQVTQFDYILDLASLMDSQGFFISCGREMVEDIFRQYMKEIKPFGSLNFTKMVIT